MPPKVLGDQSRLVLRMISFSSAANVAWYSGVWSATSFHSHNVYPPDIFDLSFLVVYLFEVIV